jgi:hypothetical protein
MPKTPQEHTPDLDSAIAQLQQQLGDTQIIKLAADLQKPKVVFTTPAAWRCDETVKLTGKRGVEKCTRCVNIARAPSR